MPTHQAAMASSPGIAPLGQEADAGTPDPVISVVTTVLNEHKGIRDMLDSVVLQEPAHELIVVDAGSTDGTWEILESYARRFAHVRPVRYPGKRGAGRNMGVRLARAPRVAFIDGDCIANAFWLRSLMAGFATGAEIVAGRTVYMGYWAFTNMQRVELPHRGHDTTWPSCNLAYDKARFLDVGGFDERFVTAEDIDLNFRAIDEGARVRYAPEALVYARARDSIGGFLKQAFWNGFGRKQLTLKHGRLWHQYSFGEMLRRQKGFWARVRMMCAVWGYVRCKLKEKRADYRTEAGGPATFNPALHAAPAPSETRTEAEPGHGGRPGPL